MSIVNVFTEETKGILVEKHHRSSLDTLDFPLRLFLFLSVAVVSGLISLPEELVGSSYSFSTIIKSSPILLPVLFFRVTPKFKCSGGGASARLIGLVSIQQSDDDESCAFCHVGRGQSSEAMHHCSAINFIPPTPSPIFCTSRLRANQRAARRKFGPNSWSRPQDSFVPMSFR